MAEKDVRKLAAVMFTDIEGYTAFVQKDEKAALQKVSIHRQYLEQYTAEYNGRVIAFYGDGSLSIYESALDAVHCAIAMQKAYQSDHPIPVRIGIHVGDIVFKDGSVFGDGVNIASRLQTAGIPGSIFISDRVRAELTNHPEIKTKSLGQRKLKNVSTPVELFVVTNEGLTVPSGMTKMPDMKKFVRVLPLIVLGLVAWWFFNRPGQLPFLGENFRKESISVPVFTNNTGDPTLEHISQMAAHWITKELSATPEAHVVSYETASEMIKLADVSLASTRGQKKYASLTGAVNVVEAFYTKTGNSQDSLLMSGYIRNLQTGDIIQSLDDVRCRSSNPMDCIQAMSSHIKGYWVSKDDKPLSPPTYEAYKAYLAAKAAWRTQDKEFIFGQLQKAIALDSTFIDPYFLMLDFFYNEHKHQDAFDTIQSIQKKFTDLDQRQTRMLQYHTADVAGRKEEAYRTFMLEYQVDPMDMFINNSAMVMAMAYVHDPRAALRFFDAIPFDSLHIDGCSYCGERLELAMWAALEIDSMDVADMLASKIKETLFTRQSYGTLIQYYVWKNDTIAIDELLDRASADPNIPTWQYLVYLTSRLYMLRDNKAMSLRYAGKSIEVSLKLGDRTLARSYYHHDQLPEALRIYESQLKKGTKDVRILAEMGMIYSRLSDRKNAEKMVAQLESGRKDFDYGYTEYYQGRIYALLGDFEKAVSLLRTALEKGCRFDLWATFTHDPDLMVLKEYPAYKKLIGEG
jgi:class 3 adenylate cyclase/tetratricopeptide (TPR) repeat protein